MSTTTTSSGDLWAQVSLGIATVDYPYPATSPVDDQANSLQTIDGQQYLVAVSIGGGALAPASRREMARARGIKRTH